MGFRGVIHYTHMMIDNLIVYSIICQQNEEQQVDEQNKKFNLVCII